MKGKTIGVALILVFGEKVLVVEELETKERFGKFAGDHSVLMETTEEGETLEQALVRLIHEEAPEGTVIDPTFGFKYLCEVDILDVATVHTYVARFLGADGDDVRPEFRHEVRVVGWMDPGDLLEFRCREGVSEMLAAYLDEYVFEHEYVPAFA
jgi:hypothetical protein